MPNNILVPQILSRVKRTMHRRQMVSPGEQLGVAVSGGSDSVVLLDVLVNLRAELHISLTVLHLNHGIRGQEATRDQRFVQDLSKRYALPCLTKKVDVPRYIQQTSLSLQEAARALRYRFFEDMMQSHDLDKVAVAQTADDQVETVLMRFIKGGGPRGLKGIPYVRGGTYVRPLLDIWRQELLGYAQRRGLEFMEDSSNLKRIYLRNRIRHELLPYLRNYNPSIKKRLLQLAQILGEDDLYLERLAQESAKGMLKVDREVSISISRLLSLAPPLQARVLQSSFAHASAGRVLEYAHLKALLRMAQEAAGSKRMPLPGGLWAEKIYDTLILRNGQRMRDQGVNEVALQVPGLTPIVPLGIGIEATVHEAQISPGPDPQEAYLDYDRLIFPLRVRSCQPGDSFIPLGMKGRKKIKEFLIDLKIPRGQRKRIPLVTSGADICWVAGQRIDERFKIGEGTQKTLKLTMLTL